MSNKISAWRIAYASLFSLTLCGCYQYQPPFNNFQPIPKLKRGSEATIIRDLQRFDIQFIHYGDTITLVVPTDRYFLFNSPRLNDICYPGLMTIIKLLTHYNCSVIYVAGFTDDVGSRRHKRKLSQARAETMLTFLWANHINAQRLHAEGYGDKHPIGDNHWIRGSAYNRRIEIQIVNAVPKPGYLGIIK